MTRAESFSTTVLEQRSRLSPLVAGGSLLQKRLYERSSVSETASTVILKPIFALFIY